MDGGIAMYSELNFSEIKAAGWVKEYLNTRRLEFSYIGYRVKGVSCKTGNRLCNDKVNLAA